MEPREAYSSEESLGYDEDGVEGADGDCKDADDPVQDIEDDVRVGGINLGHVVHHHDPVAAGRVEAAFPVHMKEHRKRDR